MALVLADRVKETSISTGITAFTLAGAMSGFQSFGSAIGNGNSTYYAIVGDTEWEVGIGTYTAAGTSLSRTTVLASSNSGALVPFSAGTKEVFATYPAEKAVILNASGGASIPGDLALGGGLQFGSNQARVFYAPAGSPQFFIIKNYDTATQATVLDLVSPTPTAGIPSGESREATLSLVIDDNGGNAEFLDLYNNHYPTSSQYGIRIQKRGTGVLRPFVFDFYDGTTTTESMRIDTSGNVSIGYGYDVGYVFAVNGDLYVRGITVGIGGTSGSYSNTAFGAGANASLNSGADNTALGYRCLIDNDYGNGNVAIGANAASDQTSPNDCVAIGSSALTGANNPNGVVAIGKYSAIFAGDYSIAIGWGALAGGSLSSSTGSSNIAIGYGAINIGTTGNNNIAIGENALSDPAATSFGGGYNVCIGTGAGKYIGNGNNNVVIGGDDGFNIANTSNNVILASGTGTRVLFSQNGTTLYLYTSGTARFNISNTGVVTINNLAGTGSRTVTADASGQLSASSDASLKQEVVGAAIPGLAEIMQVQPRAYKWLSDIDARGDDAATEIGFFANEVAPIIPSAAPKGEDGLYGFYDRSMIAALVKAVQEQQATIQSLTARIEQLESTGN